MTMSATDHQVRDRLSRVGIQCLWQPSPNHNSRPADAPIDTLIVHYTALEFEASITHLSCPEKGVSTHYVVDRDGTLVQLVSLSRRGWHAGMSSLHGRPDVNSYSVGLDLVFVPATDREFTAVQYRVLGQLTRALLAILPISTSNIVGHEDVALPPGRKTDPGPAFNWTRYFSEADLEGASPLVLEADRG